MTIALAAVIGLSYFSVIIAWVKDVSISIRLSSVVIMVLSAIVFVASLFLLRLFTRRYADQKVLLDTINVSVNQRIAELSFSPLLMQYFNIMASVDEQARDEIFFTLASRIADMPDNVGENYVSQFLDRIEIDPSSARRLQEWAREFLKLGRQERKIMLEQIRRVILSV